MRTNQWWPSAAVAVVLALSFAFVAPGYVHRYHIVLPAVIAIYASFVLAVLVMVTPGSPVLAAWKPPLPLLPVIWCLPYLAYAAGTRDFQFLSLGKLLGLSSAPLLVYAGWPVREQDRFSWQDLAVAVLFIAVVLTHQLKGIWNVPANLDFMGRLFLIGVAAWLWTFVRAVPGLGYRFGFTAKTGRAALLNFGLFALVALPASLALHFTAWNPQWPGLGAFLVAYLEIFLFIALLEELFFRGFLQTLLSETLRSTGKGQAIVACLFGLFHILHAPFPNWRYVLLATAAGWFYGSAFRQGGNLIASATAHALVDTLWRTFLSKS